MHLILPLCFSGLDNFDFVFLILLRHVDKTSNLAQIIINQHVYLDGIDPNFITSILKGRTNHNVLLLIDGYDEYSPGTNQDIDKLVNQGIGNCLIILTSRPGYLDKQIRDRFDGEITIEGFSEENIKLCSSKYLQSEEKSDKLLQQAKDTGIDDLLRVPITLLMTCVVYDEKEMLPNRKTELVKTIFEMFMNRTTLKSFNRKSYDVESVEMIVLGKFLWQSLQNDVNQLLLNKVRCDKHYLKVHLFHLMYVLITLGLFKVVSLTDVQTCLLGSRSNTITN